jgi:hypothetical protein
LSSILQLDSSPEAEDVVKSLEDAFKRGFSATIDAKFIVHYRTEFRNGIGVVAQ